MKLDILAFGAHPDDVELACSGTIAAHIAQGKTVGIVDLTQGELGTRGSAPQRLIEASNAAKLLGVKVRENLGMADGFFEIDTPNKLKVIEMLRKYRPDVVFCNAVADRHTDHGKGGDLVQQACFLSGLRKIETTVDGELQQPWRPKLILRYIQDYHIKPDVVIDITPYIDLKMAAVQAFETQFYNPGSSEPETPISGKHFLEAIRGRCLDMGRYAGVQYAEGFTAVRPVGVKDVTSLF